MTVRNKRLPNVKSESLFKLFGCCLKNTKNVNQSDFAVTVQVRTIKCSAVENCFN